MSYLTSTITTGGQGGSPFDFTGIRNGATLKKIWVWVGDSHVKALKVWLTDGQSRQFGIPAGYYSEFTFEDGEQFSSLSLWANGDGTRLGAIKFRTNRCREFFAHMTQWGSETEDPIDIGSGICMGIVGRSGSQIDRLGLVFINTIKSTVLTKVQYPTLDWVVPSVVVEEIGSETYQNTSTSMQEYKLNTPVKTTKESSWSVSNFTFNIEVQAQIPEVAEIKNGFSYTLGSKNTYALGNIVENTEIMSIPASIPPGKTMKVDITIGRATVDLPYTGTVQITCLNDSVLEIQTSGTYKGLTYTSANTVMKELP